MDPSGTDQTPPQMPPDAPPQWGQPVPQTPPEATPSWTQPGVPGQPGFPPPGAWAPPAAAPKRSRRLYGLIAAVLVIVVLGVIGFVVVGLNSGVGQVTFSKAAGDPSTTTCKFSAPVSEITTTDTVYMMAYFHDTLNPGDSLTFTITKDGAAFGDNTISISDKVNCDIEPSAIGPLQAGVYKLTFTHNGKVEAEGTLTVK